MSDTVHMVDWKAEFIGGSARRTKEIPVAKAIQPEFDPGLFLATDPAGRTISTDKKGLVVYAQGDRADAVFYIQKGRIKITVLSEQGKEAVVALHGPGDFFGEGCLIGQPLRLATAKALTNCVVMRLDKAAMLRSLNENRKLADVFTTHLLLRNSRIEEDLVDQLFNSSEKRLARVLLLLAKFGKEGKTEPIETNITQETLAEMIGTTRSRVSYFMNKFRQLGFIEYNGTIEVHSSLVSILLHD
jgi:CRP/FNR family cyclic AMP-dependent transcriptional regulator